MKFRSIFGILLSVIMILSFSACSLIDFFSAESLIRPPRLTGENAALQSAVVEAVGNDINLYTPIAGEYRASYILFDINNDGDDEAVVFYSLVSNTSVVHMHLLTSKNGVWTSVADTVGSGTEVYKVDFFNIDNYQGMEIAVTWSLDDSKRERTLSVYKVASLEADSGAVNSVATIQVMDYICLDMDSDSVNEILYFYHKDISESDSVSVRLLDYSTQDQNFVPISEIQFSHAVNSFSSIQYEKVNNDYFVYVDCLSSDNTYFSKLIVFDYENSALFLPQTDDFDMYEMTKRNINVTCRDFDNDGYLNIPVQIDYEDSYTVGTPDGVLYYMTFIEWYEYSDKSFDSIGSYYVNEADGFKMKIDALYDDYYFVYDYTNAVTQVRLRNFDEENNVVFSVSKTTEPDLLNPLSAGKDVYEIIITAKGEKLKFTREYVMKLIEDI